MCKAPGKNYFLKDFKSIYLRLKKDSHICFILQNGLEEIRKIAKFLDVPENEELCKAIHEKCHFKKMAVDKAYKEEIAQIIFKNGFSLFRKGSFNPFTPEFL